MRLCLDPAHILFSLNLKDCAKFLTNSAPLLWFFTVADLSLSARPPYHFTSPPDRPLQQSTRHQSGLEARVLSDSHGHAPPQAPQPPLLQLPLVATMVTVPLLPAGIVALIRLIRRFVLFEWDGDGATTVWVVKRIIAFRTVERLLLFGDSWENGSIGVFESTAWSDYTATSVL